MTRTALLVIDIQRGAFDGVRCPPMDAPQALLDSASTLLAAAREGDAAVVFVLHGEQEPGSPFGEGCPHAELHDSLVPAAGDLRVHKRASSSFEGTDLDTALRARGVDALVLCGLQSEFCVSNTARSALALGYAVHVAEDGHGTWPSEGRSAAEIRQEANASLAAAGARLAPTAQLAETLRRAAA